VSERIATLAPRQWFRIEHASAEAAELFIFDEISPWGVTAADFVRELVGLPHPVLNLHLNTPGGDVFDGLAIFNALVNHPATVNVYIEALAASIGTVIAMAGDRIVIAPHARMMIHEAWGVVMGNASDMAKMAERLAATSDNIAAIYSERAGGEVAGWRDLMREETWYTDQQAVAAGLADEVGRSNDDALKQAASFDLSIFRHGEREAARLRAEVTPEEPEDAPVEVSDEDPPSDITTEEPTEPETVEVEPRAIEITRERLAAVNEPVLVAAEAALARDAARAAIREYRNG
jgi:ATP-dependent protease ClpP protease subunit